MKKWMGICVTALALCAAGVYYCNTQKNNAAKAGESQHTAVKAEYVPLRQEVTCSGTVESNQDVEIKCKASGQIVLLPFDISDPVKEGELLLKIDPVDEERNVQLAEVKLASTEAKLARAKQNLVVSERELQRSRREVRATLIAAEASSKDQREKARRMETLRDKDYASPEEVDSAEVAAVQAESTLEKAHAGAEGLKADEERLELLRQDIYLAQADVDSCKIELETAKQRRKETQVFAPMAGVISERLVQVGQIISSPTMNVGGGTSLMTLSDLSRIFVLASVDESDIGLVNPGQPVTITVDAFPEEHFQGEVVRVATKGSLLSNVVTFEVKIEVLDESRQKLRPAMTADVNILVAASERALAVPAQAVTRRGPQKVVLTPGVNSQEPTVTPVTTGIDDGAYTEIVSGLSVGDIVLIPDADAEAAAKSSQRGIFGGPPPGGGPPPM